MVNFNGQRYSKLESIPSHYINDFNVRKIQILYSIHTRKHIIDIKLLLVITYINCCRVIQNEEKKMTPP